MPLYIVVEIIVLLGLLGLSAFFSGSETALTALSRLTLKKMLESGEASVEVEEWMRQPDKLLATILIANNVVNVAASIMAHVIVEQILLSVFNAPKVAAFSGGIAFAGITFMLLVFGEIAPKTYAKQHPARLATKAAKVLNILYIAFLGPVVKVFQGISNLFLRMMGAKLEQHSAFFTEEDLRFLVKMGHDEGVLEKDEQLMIHSIFEFGDTVAREVMVPRIDMNCIEVNAIFDEVLAMVVEKGNSRIPVYEDNADNIIGILYAKDLLALTGEEKNHFDLRKIIRPAFFVPESKSVAELLREFKRQQTHIAIVVDEYGGTEGLVTIEDVLEEIVGEIRDEYDIGEKDLVSYEGDGSMIINAIMDVDDLRQFLDIEFPDDGFETLGGFIYALCGHVPEKGEAVMYQGYRFMVMELEDQRIVTVKVEQIEKPAEREKDSDSETDKKT